MKQLALRVAVLSASDRIRAELKELVSALIQCTDSGIRNVIEEWIVEAKEKQITGEVKTVHSAKPLSLDARLLEVLKMHKQRSEYTELGDWVFASPELDGKIPRSYTCFYEKLGRACQDAGIKHVSADSFRHSYRAWLDELGTPISVRCATGTSGSR
jgi:integrase